MASERELYDQIDRLKSESSDKDQTILRLRREKSELIQHLGDALEQNSVLGLRYRRLLLENSQQQNHQPKESNGE